jgi:uncharacterized damage-inducible protein DinB
MFKDELKEIFIRELNKLEEEISAYADESKLWIIKGEIKNSAGNLCLHLNGNLQYYIGAILGETGYVRNRDAEFADKNIPRSRLIELIYTSRKVINETLNQLTDENLMDKYPLQVLGKEMVTTRFFLIHIATHLTYHLGQINYHRRLTA